LREAKCTIFLCWGKLSFGHSKQKLALGEVHDMLWWGKMPLFELGKATWKCALGARHAIPFHL
jgi:hypothetical protein